MGAVEVRKISIKLGSLFDGIGTFPLSGVKYGIIPVWASEIELFPIKATQCHFPDMKHLGDITKINGAEIEPVDVICGGFPCQDVSVAGLRAGLDGRRSGLFFEAARVIEEMLIATNREYPKFVVIENVPGLLSSNNGKDMEAVLDTMQELGFVIDTNILDAQYMGVPQRRRRVFIVCQNVETILQQRTISSVQIIIQLLTECLLIRWVELLKALGREPEKLDLRTKNLAVGGLQKRIQLFSLHKEERLNLLLMNLKEMLVIYLQGLDTSESNLGANVTTQENTGDTRSLITPEMVANILASDLFTPLSWKNILGEGLQQKNESTISTEISETIESKIYYCAEMLLNIAKYTILLNPSCQSLLSEESLILTGLKECTNYARQTSNELFTDMEWILHWNDYLQRVSDCREQIERYFGGQCAGEILFKCESLSRYSAESRETGEEAARDAGESVKTAGGNSVVATLTASYGTKWNGNGGADTGDNFIISPANRINSTPEGIAGTVSSKWAKGTGGPAGDECYNLVIEPRSQDGVCRIHDDGIVPTLNTAQGGQRQPCVVVFNGRQDPVSGEKSGSLDTCRPQAQCICYPDPANVLLGKANLSFRDDSDTVVAIDCRNLNEREELSGTLQSKCAGGYSLNYQNPVRVGYKVRRLTPLECERLQGLPGGWTDIPGASDTARYKAIGNGIAKPCSDFVIGRIAEVLRKESNHV